MAIPDLLAAEEGRRANWGTVEAASPAVGLDFPPAYNRGRTSERGWREFVCAHKQQLGC